MFALAHKRVTPIRPSRRECKVRAFGKHNNQNLNNPYHNYDENDRVQVFQVPEAFVDIRICDVRESFDTCANMNRKEKQEYFYTQGIDYEKAVKYWTIVTMLNRLYKFH